MSEPVVPSGAPQPEDEPSLPDAPSEAAATPPGAGATPTPDASDASPAAATDADAPAAPPAADLPCAARARGLTVRLGGQAVLRDVDLDLPTGHVTALLGPEGAGKTTLLRVLLGLEARAGGEVVVLGKDPARDAIGLRQVVGFVPERPALYETMTAMTLGRFVADLYPTWQPRTFLDHLARLGVPPRLRVSELSRSQAARLALAAALGPAPRLLLVDVPHDLDALGRHELLEGVDDDAAASERTVLIATSRPHEVERIARHVVVLAAGQVRFAGAVDDLRRRCRRLEVTAAEPPPLPAGARALRWRAPTAHRPGELHVLADDPQLDLSTLAGVAGVHAVGLEEAYLALVATPPVA